MTVLLRFLVLLGSFFGALHLSYGAERPNLLVVVADDMGFSDLGSFGSNIATPNFDRLADEGLILTNFHTAATCSPTRSMLLSGVDHHLAGLGSMAEILADNQRGQPGYEGYLNNRVVSLATRLHDGGYHTYMTGKWHLGKTPQQGPAARGFERSFALLEGGSNHFNDGGLFPRSPTSHFREDGEYVKLPENFYSSRSYTDKLLSYLGEHKDDNKPFFAYLAYTAPHWPLQAPREVIEKYRGQYDAGYDVLRTQRIAALAKKGIIPGEITQRLDQVPYYRPWKMLSPSEQAAQARTMEVYAAMIDEMDRQFGRVLAYLAETGELENTVIVFLSDNGAEGVELATTYKVGDWLASEFDNSLENMGNADSYLYMGPGWATAVMAPFYQVKRSAAEGGIRTPAFVWNPGLLRQGEISDALITVKDIAPTLLDLAGIDFKGSSYAGRSIEPISGRSLTSLLNNKEDVLYPEHDALAWELFGHRAVRRGDWKLEALRPPYGDGMWRLYNLKTDLAEQQDLAKANPEKVAQLLRDWEEYAAANGVILPDKKEAIDPAD